MVKHKKTIKRQRNLQKQRGKGLCSSKQPSENNSVRRNNLIQMNNVPKKKEEGDKLYVNITTNLELANKILDNIKSKSEENQQAEINKVKNLIGLTMKLKEIDVIKTDTEKYKTIIIKLIAINRRIKVLNESNA